MSSNAIVVEQLSKRYLLPRAARSRTARERVIGHLREYTSFAGRDNVKDYIWALRDVSFSVAQGEILGVVGRNGSGKSTLLKILSGVTQPTKGRAQLHGRVGSLLEVGTGFHPDMSGRENVFMAGALLGLSQADVRKQFDEIVAFAELERFIDVPVKRYSSGMYVRLAFSVASLLHSDILILDEVLAVGDASFKKKSERNIQRIAKDGRTIIIVSHAMQAIRDMCKRAIVLERGRLVAVDDAREAVTDYLHIAEDAPPPVEDAGQEGAVIAIKKRVRVDIETLPPRVDLADVVDPEWERPFKTITSVETLTSGGVPTRSFTTGESMIVRIGYRMPVTIDPCYFTVFVFNEDRGRVLVLYSLHDHPKMRVPEEGVIECRVDDLRLIEGEYIIGLDFGRGEDIEEAKYLDYLPEATRIKVGLGDYFGGSKLLHNQGAFAQKSAWQVVGPSDENLRLVSGGA